jgi:hypothetical protein
MRRTIVAAVAAFALGGILTGVLLARAQPSGPPDAGAPPAGIMTRGPAMGPGMGLGMGPWAAQMNERHARRMELMRTFALVPPADDRKLTPPDVQKIAEAFLAWKGNHEWKVLNVKPDGDVIGFDLATQEGSVIARFTMDPKSGHVTRRG